MRICLLGDTHFGVRNDSKAFHAYYEKFYDETFFPKLAERGVRQSFNLVICLTDESTLTFFR